MSKYFIFFTFCLLKNSVSFCCWSAQWRFLSTGFLFCEVITRQENNIQEIPPSYYDRLCLAVLAPCNRRDFESACSPLTFIWDTLSEHVECKIPSSFFYVTNNSYHYLRWLLFWRCRDPHNKKRDHLRLFLLLQWYL